MVFGASSPQTGDENQADQAGRAWWAGTGGDGQDDGRAGGREGGRSRRERVAVAGGVVLALAGGVSVVWGDLGPGTPRWYLWADVIGGAADRKSVV